jgi:hypothetical protein
MMKMVIMFNIFIVESSNNKVQVGRFNIMQFACFSIFEFDDDHVDGARMCLITVATRGPLFIPQVICEHGEPWWNDIDSLNFLICPPKVSGNPTSSHLVLRQGELGKKMMNLALGNTVKLT